jgi:hypothetical protein
LTLTMSPELTLPSLLPVPLPTVVVWLVLTDAAVVPS